jgi:hypothetical protein
MHGFELQSLTYEIASHTQLSLPALGPAGRLGESQNYNGMPGCWLLVAGCWLLVAGCWLLVAGKTQGGVTCPTKFPKYSGNLAAIR